MVNKVTLIGRVGKNPEVRHFDNGGSICNFTVATTEKWKKDGQVQERTDWHNITVRGGAVNFCEKYLKKGDLVYLEGKLQTRDYDKDGVKHYITEVVCFTVQSLMTKEKGAETAEKAPKTAQIEASEPTGDLPF